MRISVDQALKDILHGIGDTTYSKYSVLARMVPYVLNDLKINLIWSVSDEVGDVEDDGTVKCVDDVVDVYRVGKVLNDKTVRLLGYTARWVNPSCSCGVCAGTDAPVCERWTFKYVPGYGEMYAARTELHDAQWYYDKYSNKIHVTIGDGVNIGDKIVYTYASSGFKSQVIESEHFMLFKARLLWEYYKGVDIGMAEYWRRLTMMEVSNYKRWQGRKESYEDIVAGWVSSKNTP